MLLLRPYQEEAKGAVYDHLRSRDDNPCVVIPTAGGKTPVMASICKDAVTLWNGRVLILAHVKELLEQAADKLTRVCPEVRFGVYSAALGRRDTRNSVIVAGVQSVHRRACELDAFNLIMIDEGHMIPPEGEGMYRQFLADARVVNPDLRIVGFTATPFRMKTGTICTPEGFLNHVCYEVGVRELIRDGYLCPLVTKAAKAKVDTAGLHVRGGEFVADELEGLMDQDELVVAACAEIVECNRDRWSCLVFASGIQHGRHVVETLMRRHGLACGLVTGQTPTHERDELLRRFRAGALKYLVNVNVLTTGFDAPNIDCVALLRPTLSPGLYYQMCLDMATEVLTPSGWRRCHEVATGGVVAAFDLHSEEIVYVPALDKVHRALRAEESMYAVTAPHLDIRVTDQHNMVVRCKAKTCLNWQVRPAREVAQRREVYTIPVAGRGDAFRDEAPLTDAEVAFVGWFLTDGYLNRTNRTVSITQSAAKFADEVRQVLAACGFGFREYRQQRAGRLAAHADGPHFVIPEGEPRGENAGKRGWSERSAWLDKDVPAIFNTLSTRQFGILLHAMNLANGTRRSSSSYQSRVLAISVGCRQRMADRIQQLGIERGYRCNVARVELQPSEWNPHPQEQWLIRVKRQRLAYLGGTQRHGGATDNRSQLAPVAYRGNEWVWCLTTEKGTLVTRRNGKVAVVGNCGRGFRLHPAKDTCLVLDFGDNVLRHGPVDQIRVKERGDARAPARAPAKECPECRAVIAAGYATCPDCGHKFPPPERRRHQPRADEMEILSSRITTMTFPVQDVLYSLHAKRSAGPGEPRTLRVDYRVGRHRYKSEWVCFEHTGYARHRAAAWWRRRSPDPVPATAERAAELAEAGALAMPKAITVRSIEGDPYERIVAYDLGPLPEPILAGPADCCQEVPF